MLVGIVTFSNKSFITANLFTRDYVKWSSKQSRTPRVCASNFDLNNKERSWEFLVVHLCIDDVFPSHSFLVWSLALPFGNSLNPFFFLPVIRVNAKEGQFKQLDSRFRFYSHSEQFEFKVSKMDSTKLSIPIYN